MTDRGIRLDWSRLLGFDQVDASARTLERSPRAGAGGAEAPGRIGAKVGMPKIGAKVGMPKIGAKVGVVSKRPY